MEYNVKIYLADHKHIYGTLRKSEGAKYLLIFVHGLAGNKNEHIFFNGSKYLSKYECDSFRFNLYDLSTDTRNFQNTTLQIHASDLTCVVNHFRTAYSHIHIVGHSLGCFIILLSDISEISSIIFWEPSQDPKTIFSQATFCQEHKGFFMKARLEFLIGKEMVECVKNLPSIPSLLKRIKVPIKIITASKAGWKIGSEIYFNHANMPKALHRIEGAGHTFDENGTEEELFTETLKWIQRN